MKRILIIILILGLIGGVIGYKMYNKAHENIETAAVDLSVPANEIFNDFENDESAANAKYNDKTVVVEGVISDISKEDDNSTAVTLDAGGDFGGVICQLEKGINSSDLKVGDKVSLKGKCTGYLMDVILVRCVRI